MSVQKKSGKLLKTPRPYYNLVHEPKAYKKSLIYFQHFLNYYLFLFSI